MALFDVVLQEMIIQTAVNYETIIARCQSFGYTQTPAL
jgi:hypothetical protein